MADTGPLLTSCIIFYLSIGAAIFQILEESNWVSAKDKYILQKENILRNYACLTKEALEDILEIVSEAAGQGVTITGDNHKNTWDWANSVIFAASIVTTIGYGNVAPKTKGGRVFCILYGLCGIPLCLVWISRLGSFFGDRAKRLSGIMIRKGVSVKKIQFTCTALFLLWGLFVHLVIPPFVFMSMEGWTYLEGIYFSFITLTTVGFGDYVAGVNPDIEYPRLYRVLSEFWIYMGLAWLSLFFSWNVNMVAEAHKVFRKRRHRQKHLIEEEPESEPEKLQEYNRPTVIDIFDFNSDAEQDYSSVIKGIGIEAKRHKTEKIMNRSKSCSDILANHIQTLDRSPRHRRRISISDVFSHVKADMEKGQEENVYPAISESMKDLKHAETMVEEDTEDKDSCAFESEGIVFTVPAIDPPEEESVQHPEGGETRFKICKVVEQELLLNKDEEG